MEQGVYINYNGELSSSQTPLIFPTNRSFRYGDGLFETIRMANGKIQFFSRHIQRLFASVILLRLELPEHCTESFFKHEIEKVAAANSIEKGARIRLTVFRDAVGFYTPKKNSASFIIECDPIHENHYEINEAGYVIDIFYEHKKPLGKLYGIKSNNALLYILAGVHRMQNNLDECIILNQNFSITEAISYNIFAVKNRVLYTPPLDEGCLDGIMRQHIIEISKQNRIAVYEVPLAMNVLLNSDEIFLTNVINGIRWVGAYKAKRYFNTIACLLNEKLNESLEK